MNPRPLWFLYFQIALVCATAFGFLYYGFRAARDHTGRSRAQSVLFLAIFFGSLGTLLRRNDAVGLVLPAAEIVLLGVYFWMTWRGGTGT